MPNPATAKWPRPKSEDEWEDMVLDAMRLRWKDPNAQRNGRRGQRQDGVDIFGRKGTLTVAAQAKNTDALSESAALAEIAKAEGFEPKLDEYSFTIGGRRDAQFQKFARVQTAERAPSGKFAVHALFFPDIVHELAADLALVGKYWGGFQAILQKVVNGLPVALTGPVLDSHAARVRISDVPGYEELVDEVSSKSNGTVGMNVRVEEVPQLDAEPGSPERRWQLAIAESHPTHLATLIRLAVDVDSGEVFYSLTGDRWYTRDEWLQTGFFLS